MPLYAADLGVSGLSDVGVQELKDDKTEAVARTQTGVTELGSTGIYYRNFTPDSTTALLYWNSTGTASAYAVGSVIDESIDAILADTGTTLPAQISGLNDPTAAAIADAVWDEAVSGHTTNGTFGQEVQDTYTAVQSIGATSGGALNYEAAEDNTGGAIIGGITFVGTQTGTFANTDVEDGSYHQIDHAANDLDIVYGFNVGGGRTAVEVTFKGYLSGVGDDAVIQVYDHVGAGWDTIATLDGQNGSSNTTIVAPLLAKHTGTGSEIGNVYIRIDGEGDDSSPVLHVDLLNVAAVSIGQTVGYADGAIWIDTSASNTNTEAYVDGVADNPVSTWAAALTLSSSLNITRFHVKGGSTLTLTANSDNYAIIGDGLFTLNLGGQSIASAYIKLANISGTGSGSGAIVEDCRINASTSMGPGYFVRCGFNTPTGTPFTANGAGEYAIVDSISLVAGGAQPYFDFSGTGSTTTINVRRWGGGFNYTGDTNATASIEIAQGGTCSVAGGGNVDIRGTMKAVSIVASASEDVEFVGLTGHVTISGTATAATIGIRGVITDITDTSTNTTVDDDAVHADTQAAILVDTGTTIPGILGTPAGADLATDIASIQTDTTAIETDTQDIQSRLPASLSSGNIKADVLAISTSTAAADNLEASASTIIVDSVAVGITETTTTLKGGGTATLDSTDDHYNGRIIIFTSGVLQKQATDITDYTGSANVFTVTALTEAPSDGDTFVIV